MLALVFASAACATRSPIVFPTGLGRPLVDYATTFEQATRECRQVRTMELSMAISGRIGESRLRGDVLGALARPGAARLVGVAPFGAPGFELVVEPGQAILLLPRERRFVRDATAPALLEALAGLPLGADDLRAVLTGCVVPEPRAVAGRAYPDEWIGIELDGAARLYLRPVDGVPVVVGGARPGLQVEYSDHVRGLPRSVHVRVDHVGGVPTDLTARLSQININIDLHPEVFDVQLNADYRPLTLEQFRRTGGHPLEAAPSGSGPFP